MGGEGSPDRRHDGRTRVRAWRIRLSTLLSRRGVRSALRLGLIAAYSVVFMCGGFFDWAGWAETILWSLGVVLWIAVATMLVRELMSRDRRLRHVAVNPSLVLLLVAPAFLWLTWMPLAAFMLVVVAYVLDLRNHSAGDGFLFSFGLVLFVGVFAGLSMVEVEYENPESNLDTPSDAIFWAFASLLRINYGKALSPVTEEGRILATVVGICAVLCASLFTAQVVKWLVGTKAEERRRRPRRPRRRRPRRRLRRAWPSPGATRRSSTSSPRSAPSWRSCEAASTSRRRPTPRRPDDPRVRWTDERPDAPHARRRTDRSTPACRPRAPCSGPAGRGPAGGRGAGPRARPVARRGLPAAARLPGCGRAGRPARLPGCGRARRTAHLPAAPAYPAAYPPPAYPAVPAAPTGPQTSSNAIIALILAIVSWAVCPIIPAIVALVLASSAAKEIEASGGRVQGAGLVTASRIVSWVNIGLWSAMLVIGAFFLVLAIVAGGLNRRISDKSDLCPGSPVGGDPVLTLLTTDG